MLFFPPDVLQELNQLPNTSTMPPGLSTIIKNDDTCDRAPVNGGSGVQESEDSSEPCPSTISAASPGSLSLDTKQTHPKTCAQDPQPCTAHTLLGSQREPFVPANGPPGLSALYPPSGGRPPGLIPAEHLQTTRPPGIILKPSTDGTADMIPVKFNPSSITSSNNSETLQMPTVGYHQESSTNHSGVLGEHNNQDATIVVESCKTETNTPGLPNSSIPSMVEPEKSDAISEESFAGSEEDFLVPFDPESYGLEPMDCSPELLGSAVITFKSMVERMLVELVQSLRLSKLLPV